ncbi:MAG: hypothetical protein H5U00_08950 [Clostridia bacterium]|nr:hypothetical protein [Clostridia bacterium]
MVRKKALIMVVTLLFTFGAAAGVLAAPKGVPPGQARKEMQAEKGVQAGEAVQERDREREEAAGQPPADREKKTFEVKRNKNQTRARTVTPEEEPGLQARPLEERLRIGGMNLKFDIPPVIKYGRTLVPVRAISRGLGAQVAWDAQTMTVTITRGDTVVTLALGSREMLVNGEPVIMDVPAQLISNRTFVPIRFIAAALGERVNYDPETGDIDIGEPEDVDEGELAEETEEGEEESPASSTGEGEEGSAGESGVTEAVP